MGGVTLFGPLRPASCPSCRRLVLAFRDARGLTWKFDPAPPVRDAVLDFLEGAHSGQRFGRGAGVSHLCPPPASAPRVRAIADQILAEADPSCQVVLITRVLTEFPPADVDRVFDALLFAPGLTAVGAVEAFVALGTSHRYAPEGGPARGRSDALPGAGVGDGPAA